MPRAVRRAFLIRDRAVIPPLEAPGGDAWLVSGTVREHSRAALIASGLTVAEVDTVAEAEAAARSGEGGAIVVHDAVAFSPAVLRSLLAAYAAGTAPAIRAALPASVATRRLSHISGLDAIQVDGVDAFTAPLYAIEPGARVAEAVPALLPFKEHIAQIPTAPGMLGNTSVPFGATETWMCRVDHWVHIQRLNVSALITQWTERGKTLRGKLWFLWRALLGFPWRRGRLFASIRRIHRKAKVHHTAYVELSVVEEGAEIGARAVVKNSYIGKGARIEDGAFVNACVVGPGATVSSQTSIFAAVLYPRSLAAQTKMQMCVLGEGAVAFTGSFFYDINFHSNVRVMHRGRAVDSGDRICSVCIGPWARVAGGMWFASGREIPAGSLIIQDPKNVISRLDDPVVAERMVAAVAGTLVPVGTLPPNRPDVVAAGEAATRPSLPAVPAAPAAAAPAPDEAAAERRSV